MPLIYVIHACAITPIWNETTQPSEVNNASATPVFVKSLGFLKVPERIKPIPNIHAITGMYANISRFTPDLEVKVDAPVKFRVRNAVTGGNTNK